MKRWSKIVLWTLALLLLAAVIVLVNLPTDEPAAELGAQVGEKLPDFSVECLDGSTFTLSEQHGKTVVINLWATWCTPCVKELPHFDRLYRERGGNVAVLALHSELVTSDVAEYLSAYDYAMPFAVADAELIAQLGGSTVLPQTIIVGPDGVVTYNQVGSLDYDTLSSLLNAE